MSASKLQACSTPRPPCDRLYRECSPCPLHDNHVQGADSHCTDAGLQLEGGPLQRRVRKLNKEDEDDQDCTQHVPLHGRARSGTYTGHTLRGRCAGRLLCSMHMALMSCSLAPHYQQGAKAAAAYITSTPWNGFKGCTQHVRRTTSANYLELLLGLPVHICCLQHRVQEVEPEGVLRGAPAVGCSAPSQGAVRITAIPSGPSLRHCPLPAFMSSMSALTHAH